MPPVAVIGNLTQDRIDGRLRVGGGPFHAARGLRLLDAEATIVTKAADPSLVEPLAALGLPVEFRRSERTPIFAISYRGDDRDMEVEELGDPWTPEDARGWVADAVGGARWLHLAPVLRTDFDAATLAELAHGRRLLFDGQGLVRAAERGPLVEDGDFDPGLLRHVGVLKLGEDEARIVLPEIDLASIERLGVPEVLVTFGSRGSLVYCDGRLERVPARPVDADPTGAGDAFSATYVASRAAGHAPVAAAQRASRLVESLLSGA